MVTLLGGGLSEVESPLGKGGDGYYLGWALAKRILLPITQVGRYHHKALSGTFAN